MAAQPPHDRIVCLKQALRDVERRLLGVLREIDIDIRRRGIASAGQHHRLIEAWDAHHEIIDRMIKCEEGIAERQLKLASQSGERTREFAFGEGSIALVMDGRWPGQVGLRGVRQHIADLPTFIGTHSKGLQFNGDRELREARTRYLDQMIRVKTQEAEEFVRREYNTRYTGFMDSLAAILSAGGPQYVTLDQMAARVKKGKRTLERYKTKGELPNPNVEGGGGKADLWIWANVRPWLEETFGMALPSRLPEPDIMSGR